jgi:hypothetical protein
LNENVKKINLAKSLILKEMSDKLLKNGNIVLWIGIVLVIISPFILTVEKFSFISFKDTGTIGDTIGGITSPITNIIGSILVYYALKAQIDANNQIQLQLKRQDGEKILNDKINYINTRINPLGVINQNLLKSFFLIKT